MKVVPDVTCGGGGTAEDSGRESPRTGVGDSHRGANGRGCS